MNGIHSASTSTSASSSPRDTNVSAIVKCFEDSTRRCRPAQRKSRQGPDLGTQEYEGKLYAEKLQSDADCPGSVPAIPARPALEKGKERASLALQNCQTSDVWEDGSLTASYDIRVRELESELASAREDVSRISAQHKKCEDEIHRLRGEVAASRRAKLEAAEDALDSIAEMNDHIARLKSQIEMAEQGETELRKDLEASRRRERNLIRQIEKLGETVIEASKELQEDCEHQISRRRELRNGEGCEKFDRRIWNPAHTDTASPRSLVDGSRQSEHESDSTHGSSVFDSTATSTSPRGTLTSTYTDLTAYVGNEQNKNSINSTARKDQRRLNSTKTSRRKTNAKGSKDRLALRRNNDWTSMSVGVLARTVQ